MARQTSLSEHDQGYKLGLENALKMIEDQRRVSCSMAETKREKEAIHKVCEILRIQLGKQVPSE